MEQRLNKDEITAMKHKIEDAFFSPGLAPHVFSKKIENILIAFFVGKTQPPNISTLLDNIKHRLEQSLFDMMPLSLKPRFQAKDERVLTTMSSLMQGFMSYILAYQYQMLYTATDFIEMNTSFLNFILMAIKEIVSHADLVTRRDIFFYWIKRQEEKGVSWPRGSEPQYDTYADIENAAIDPNFHQKTPYISLEDWHDLHQPLIETFMPFWFGLMHMRQADNKIYFSPDFNERFKQGLSHFLKLFVNFQKCFHECSIELQTSLGIQESIFPNMSEFVEYYAGTFEEIYTEFNPRNLVLPHGIHLSPDEPKKNGKILGATIDKLMQDIKRATLFINEEKFTFADLDGILSLQNTLATHLNMPHNSPLLSFVIRHGFEQENLGTSMAELTKPIIDSVSPHFSHQFSAPKITYELERLSETQLLCKRIALYTQTVQTSTYGGVDDIVFSPAHVEHTTTYCFTQKSNNTIHVSQNKNHIRSEWREGTQAYKILSSPQFQESIVSSLISLPEELTYENQLPHYFFFDNEEKHLNLTEIKNLHDDIFLYLLGKAGHIEEITIAPDCQLSEMAIHYIHIHYSHLTISIKQETKSSYTVEDLLQAQRKICRGPFIGDYLIPAIQNNPELIVEAILFNKQLHDEAQNLNYGSSHLTIHMIVSTCLHIDQKITRGESTEILERCLNRLIERHPFSQNEIDYPNRLTWVDGKDKLLFINQIFESPRLLQLIKKHHQVILKPILEYYDIVPLKNILETLEKNLNKDDPDTLLIIKCIFNLLKKAFKSEPIIAKFSEKLEGSSTSYSPRLFSPAALGAEKRQKSPFDTPRV